MTAIVHPQTEKPAFAVIRPARNRWLLLAAVMAFVVSVGSVAGGIFGVAYTYNEAAAQSIVTPDDASIPETPVRGPLTMLAQKDIITQHQLEGTDGLYYAEMSREVAQLDEAGQPVVDEAGETVMVPNEARTSWITATTLTTSLGLGILAYGLSIFAIVVGLALAASGFAFLALREKVLS